MNTKEQKLVIIVLGKRNSGKSNTWYEIFGRSIRSGWKRLSISGKLIVSYVQNSSHEEACTEIGIDIFVRNASFEEYGDDIEDYFEGDLPKIVFCSVQYVEKGKRTIEWLKDNGYYLYIQWLNPGYYDNYEYEDFLGFEKEFSSSGIFTKLSGKEKNIRAEDIKRFVFDWVSGGSYSSVGV